MFKNSENWAIVIDICDNIEQELWQLFNIYKDVHRVKMVDFMDYYTNLQYEIHSLEEKLHTCNSELNGDAIKPINWTILDEFDEARKAFNDDSKLEKWLVDHIYIEHDEIDRLADYIPQMLKYYKSLVAGTYKPQSSHSSSWANITEESFTKCHQPSIPIHPLTLYRIGMYVNNDSDDESDDDYAY